MTKNNYHLILAVIAFTLSVASALTDEERNALREMVFPVIDACGKEYEVARDQTLAIKDTGKFEDKDPCFFRCMFHKLGLIDDKGLFDSKVLLEENIKIIKGEEDLANIAQVGKTCSAVNTKDVSDGEKGCDRSKLLVSCLLEQNASFSLFA